jgi:hypothetical protein
MSSRLEDELTPERSQELRELSGGPHPPVGLEARTTEALRAHGLLRDERGRRAVLFRWLAFGAASIIFLAAGFLAGERRTRVPAVPMGNRYVLFVTTQGETESAPPKDEAGRVREYSKWARDQAAAGHLIAGEELNETSLALTGLDSRARHDSSLDILGGYFIIVANNMDEATAIARTCPHLRHGGTLVIRPIEPTP